MEKMECREDQGMQEPRVKREQKANEGLLERRVL